jgi:hypothetical protein
VECVNSVARMQQARHRKMTQGLLGLVQIGSFSGNKYGPSPRLDVQGSQGRG